jgi:uncharacterized protein YndB with AHSA1/START domain
MAAPRFHVSRTITVQAAPERVLAAFFNPEDLSEWWQVVRSVTVARPLGMYAIEWGSTDYRDEVLGRLGGAFHGTVMEYRPGAEFFVADAFWNPPDGDPIGPMALEVRCTVEGVPDVTTLVVRQSGDDDSVRWHRYFEIVEAGWQRALADLKQYLEEEPLRTRR